MLLKSMFLDRLSSELMWFTSFAKAPGTFVDLYSICSPEIGTTICLQPNLTAGFNKC
jgi:hypothetical protein